MRVVLVVGRDLALMDKDILLIGGWLLGLGVV